MKNDDVFRSLAEEYQRGEYDNALDDIFQIAAVSGDVLLPGPERPYTAAVSGPYDYKNLLLPDLGIWDTISMAYAAGNNIFPTWFSFDAERQRFEYNQEALCRELIRVYKLTRQNGRFLSDGEPVADDEVREMARQSLSIIRNDAGSQTWGCLQALRTMCKQNAIEALTMALKPSVELFDETLAKFQTDAYRPIQTGMAAFDKLLRGGIPRQSLVILTAAPGTGKTTLAQQIFETSAAQGIDVVFMNLEMSREQLLARSLSRMVHRMGGNIEASTIMRGYAWTDAQRHYIEAAATRYRDEIAPRMQYNPNTGTSLTAIMEALVNAAQTAKKAGRPAPVAVLDYLHLITADGREEQQELIKRTVAALKRWAIEYDTFVFAISANNRTSNKSAQIALDSARDSSSIEYTADIQMSLNYREVHEGTVSPNNPDEMERLQQEKPRRMVCQVLKSRMNEPGGKLYLNFDAANSEFIPLASNDQTPPPARQSVMEWRNVEDEDNPFT